MNAEKNVWKGIFVSCTEAWHAVIHEAARKAGTNASEWTRQLQEEHLPRLIEAAEAREGRIQRLLTLGNSEGFAKPSGDGQRGNEARKKKRKGASGKGR